MTKTVFVSKKDMKELQKMAEQVDQLLESIQKSKTRLARVHKNIAASKIYQTDAFVFSDAADEIPFNQLKTDIFEKSAQI